MDFATLPSTLRAQFRSDAGILAEGLSKAADLINLPRMPEPNEHEAMADHIVAAGYFGMDELIDAPASERAQLFKVAPDGRAG